ncbi:MAG: M24 family metallopeptidase [Actinobacteria bacterium]|nr:M24 family metallopeptidase [Actinomycetota bacterium]
MGNRFVPLSFDKHKLLSTMQEVGIGAMILTSPENVFYVTGYPVLTSAGNPILHTLSNQFPVVACIDREGKVMLACWLVSTLGADFGADELLLYLDREGAAGEIRKLVDHAAEQPGRVGIESTCPYHVVKMLEESLGTGATGAGNAGVDAGAGGARSVAAESDAGMAGTAGGRGDQGGGVSGNSKVVLVDALMLDMRVVKSAAEIAFLENSIRIVERSVSELFGLLRPGMSRLDLIGKAKEIMAANGASGVSHVTVSFGKENPELAIDETLVGDRLVTLDLGAFYQGYASDNRRYAYTGTPPAALVKAHDMMVDIVDQVGAALCPGTSEGDIFQLAAELFNRHGLDPFFDHAGHHVGLQTEERWITSASKRPLQVGMVVNIELYTPVEGIDFVGNEETFVIDVSGSRRISQLSREIIPLPSEAW